MEISVTNSVIANVGNNLKEKSNKLNSEIIRIYMYINNLKTVWSGTDAESYYNKILEQYIPNLKELISVISDYGNYLQKVGEAYELLDNTFATKNIE